MIKRTFYRIDEISDITRLTKSDLLDAVERQDLALCAWVEGKDFGLIRKTNVLLGLFDYNGTVSLTNQQSKTLLCEGKSIQLEQLPIQEPERIKVIIDSREQFADISSSIFSKFSYQSEVPQTPFIASGPIGEVMDLQRTYERMESRNRELSNSGSDEGINGLWKLFSNVSVKQLGIKPIGIKPEQLRFDIRKLVKHFGSEYLKQPNPLAVTNRTVNQIDSVSSQIPKPIKPQVETNPIKVMIQMILAESPDFGSRLIWNTLKDDVRMNTRRFDVDSIIDEMDSEQIIRFGVGTEAQVTTGFSRFKNLVSEVKKERKQKVSR